MELHITGKADAPAILLIPDRDMDASALAAALGALEKDYQLLIPSFAADEPDGEISAALESALGQQFAGRIWGAYGLRRGAGLLLALLARGSVRVRTAVLEGAFALPESPLPRESRYICWKNARDRAAKKSWQALKKQLPGVYSLTMKKMKKGEDLLSLRPDVMAKRLQSAFGAAAVVSRSAVLPQRTDKVWRQLCLHPDKEELARLTEKEPLRRDADNRTQLLEGSGGGLKLWSHWVRLESLGQDGTICTDQVELDAGRFNALAKPAARLYLGYIQRRRARALRKG